MFRAILSTFIFSFVTSFLLSCIITSHICLPFVPLIFMIIYNFSFLSFVLPLLVSCSPYIYHHSLSSFLPFSFLYFSLWLYVLPYFVHFLPFHSFNGKSVLSLFVTYLQSFFLSLLLPSHLFNLPAMHVSLSFQLLQRMWPNKWQWQKCMMVNTSCFHQQGALEAAVVLLSAGPLLILKALQLLSYL